MAKPIRTLVALDSGATPDALTSSLPSDGDIEIVGVVEGTDEAWRTLQDANIDVLAIACVGYSDRVLFLIESSVRQAPGRPVIVLSQGSPNGFVRRVFEVGADDILTYPLDPDHVTFAIQKGLARKQGRGAHASFHLARLVVVLGPKGGTGKTLTASNLAVSLQKSGLRTVLVDLDLQFGDVALSMGLSPERTIHDLVLSGGSLDAEKLEDFLTEHPSGVKALLAPSRPDYASAVTVELIRDVYSILREEYDVVIIDTPPGFTPEVIASIDVSTDLVMVGMLDSLSLKNTKLGLETLELMGYEPEKIKLVLNRAGTRVGISTEDVEAVLGRAPEVLVPSDREIPRTVNEGVPIATALPDSDAAKSFERLASYFRDGAQTPESVTVGASPEPRRKLFGRKG
jgi:pilus assembly protein CpaE